MNLARITEGMKPSRSAERDLVADERRAWLVRLRFRSVGSQSPGLRSCSSVRSSACLSGLLSRLRPCICTAANKLPRKEKWLRPMNQNGSEAQVDVSLDQLGVS